MRYGLDGNVRTFPRPGSCVRPPESKSSFQSAWPRLEPVLSSRLTTAWTTLFSFSKFDFCFITYILLSPKRSTSSNKNPFTRLQHFAFCFPHDSNDQTHLYNYHLNRVAGACNTQSQAKSNHGSRVPYFLHWRWS